MKEQLISVDGCNEAGLRWTDVDFREHSVSVSAFQQPLPPTLPPHASCLDVWIYIGKTIYTWAHCPKYTIMTVFAPFTLPSFILL